MKRTVDDNSKRIASLEADHRKMLAGSMCSSKEASEVSALGAFVPSHIIIKNFCDYTNRKKLGIDRIRAEALVVKLHEVLPAKLQQLIIGLEPLNGSKVYGIAIGLKDGRCAKEVIGFWRDEARVTCGSPRAESGRPEGLFKRWPVRSILTETCG